MSFLPCWIATFEEPGFRENRPRVRNHGTRLRGFIAGDDLHRQQTTAAAAFLEQVELDAGYADSLRAQERCDLPDLRRHRLADDHDPLILVERYRFANSEVLAVAVCETERLVVFVTAEQPSNADSGYGVSPPSDSMPNNLTRNSVRQSAR